MLHTSLDHRKDTRPVKFSWSFKVDISRLMNVRMERNVCRLKGKEFSFHLVHISLMTMGPALHNLGLKALF